MRPRILSLAAVSCALAVIGACAHPAVKKSSVKPKDRLEMPAAAEPVSDVADLVQIPQDVTPSARAAQGRLRIEKGCADSLAREFRTRYFAPWTAAHPLYDRSESVDNIKGVLRGSWFGVNRRPVERAFLDELTDNCALENFPSRFDRAIAVAPAHMRGVPTTLPLFQKKDDYPFDMLQYPQLKLNEPLRVLHSSRDGVWVFVESAYSNGWIEARDVALVDKDFVQAWMELPLVVLVHDDVPILDSNRQGGFRAKLGTLFPLIGEVGGSFEVALATAGEGGRVENHLVRLPGGAAVSYPMPFNANNVALVGNQLLGEPYGWGEMYGLRDCSALLRDFFLPFGIWMPRTTADQIASVPKVLNLKGRDPQEKQEMIKQQGIPFLSLIHKPGHIMLYLGFDAQGRPLVMHDAWSVRVKADAGQREQMIGKSVITTLEPGKELGLVAGHSQIERITGMGTLIDRCDRISPRSQR